MIDFGFDKLALIGTVALIVIGPEKLPRVARTVGHLLGRAQRYVAEVKAEVNRSIELEELKKMKTDVEDAARNFEQSVSKEVGQVSQDFEKSWSEIQGSGVGTGGTSSAGDGEWYQPVREYKPVKKNWRVKRAAVPQWYKQRQGVRSRVQSGAARVARFRPPRASSKAGS
ncbi:MAG TPA: Sec-independent protein translocase protein TatB [Burkholderiaceae bacterium]|nr:Sec-independent protein translocase protein TatB [Burkholderiaceae bacterium]